MNRVAPYLDKGGVVTPDQRDVPYYTISGSIALERTGDWSDFPEKQPLEVRSFMLTIPRDQLPFDVWKQTLGGQAVTAAISAAVAELGRNGTKPLIQGGG